MVNWVQSGPSVAAAFLASLVEFVEALTVILAVGTVRGWRHALAGAALGLAVLAILIAILGPALTRIPLSVLQFGIGTLLLLFGLRWLRKAILRAAGVITLHDEAAAFVEEEDRLRRGGTRVNQGWDRLAIATAFQIVMLEGVEVVFTVIAIGAAGGMLVPAIAGAGAALVVVLILGLVLHRPLSLIPENTLKFAVGVLLSAFGTFWVGEGIGVVWPVADWSLLGLIGAYLALALILVGLARAWSAPDAKGSKSA